MPCGCFLVHACLRACVPDAMPARNLARHTRAVIDAKLRMSERSEGDRQLLYLLRGMMEWCIYPPPVRADTQGQGH